MKCGLKTVPGARYRKGVKSHDIGPTLSLFLPVASRVGDALNIRGMGWTAKELMESWEGTPTDKPSTLFVPSKPNRFKFSYYVKRVLNETHHCTSPPSHGTLDGKGTQDNVTRGPHNQTPTERFERGDPTLLVKARPKGRTMQTKGPHEEAGQTMNAYASEATTMVTSESGVLGSCECPFQYDVR